MFEKRKVAYHVKWTNSSQPLVFKNRNVDISYELESHSLSYSVLVSQSQYLSPSFSDSGRNEVRKERRKENRLICLKKSTNQGQPLVFKNETVDISVEWANLSRFCSGRS